MRKPELVSSPDAKVREGCDLTGPDFTADSQKPGKTLFPCRPLTWRCLQGKRHPSAPRSRHLDFLTWDAGRVGSRQLRGSFRSGTAWQARGFSSLGRDAWRGGGTKPVHPKGTVSLTGLLP